MYPSYRGSVSFMNGPVMVVSRLVAGIVLLLGVAVALSVVWGPGPPEMTVKHSGGGSLRESAGVLIPGDSIRSGDRIQVLNDRLYLEGPGTKLQILFEPGSKARMQRVYRDPPGLDVQHRSGRGSARVEESFVRHRWNSVLLLQQHGRVQWHLTSDSLTLTRTTSTAGFWSASGETHPLGNPPRTSDLNIRVMNRQQSPPFPARETPAFYHYLGSLQPGEDVLRSLVRYHRIHGAPTSLLDVFGHWVRDRWGHVYLLRVQPGRLRLRSGGADGVIGTADDRSWGEVIKPAGNSGLSPGEE